MIVEQKVKVKWSRRTRKHFESKGYVYTKNEDDFEVNVDDLSQGSHTLVQFICDFCLGENQTEEKHNWRPYKKLLISRTATNKDCCGHMECKNKKGHETYIKNLAKKEATLGHKYPHLVSEWSSKNNISPFQCAYGSEMMIWWICENDHEWEDSILHRTSSDRGCPYCSGKRACFDNCLATTHQEISNDWHPTLNNELTPYEVTYGSDKKIWWVCRLGHTYLCSISDRTLNDCGCSICKESKGEKRIRNFLELKLINFIAQYEFDGLIGVGGKSLRFDFSIFDKMNNLSLLVEYDGEFHFNKYYKEQNFETIKIHDKRKDVYCMKNNIPLLRIPYWEVDKIEEILTKELEKYYLLSPNS